MTDESLVLEKKAKLEKKNKKSVEPIALITKQLTEQALSDNAYDGSTDDDGETLQKAMILLSQHYQKKKTGHISKECQLKKVRDSAYYRKKLELSEKRENGTALLLKEEFWMDHTDDEAANVEIAQMCLVGDDQSDDSETDEDEVYSEFDYNFISSQMNIMITAIHELRSKLISEKNLNSENEKQVLEIENEKRTNNKKKEIPFVYTSENAKYFPEKSRSGRKVLNDISPVKSSMFDDFVDPYAPNSDKKNISPIIYDSKKYTPPLVLESKIIDLEDKIDDQNILKEIESDIILSFMTCSLEEKLFSQKPDSISSLSYNFQVNKNEVSKSDIFSQNSSDSDDFEQVKEADLESKTDI
ncbi:hypothetical protein L6452_34924 [Arctium lappa]|uniref:Uncharacterized protein n=1 Tax=Arctium lappa TaxID=4217 RepID=A0ACB8YK26_ARCLA|nr:hypothetical protein L6452_34924 [Arctium lappa]